LSSNPALYESPRRVPIVSTKSIMNTVNRTDINPQVRAPDRLNFMNIPEIEGGMLTMLSGAEADPVIKAATVVTVIPIRRAPLTFSASNTIMRKSPPIDRSTVVLLISPSVTGASGVPSITTPAKFKPTKQRKRPIPTANAILSPEGIEFASQLLAPARDRTVNNTPPMKMAPRAVCQEYPRTPVTV